MKSIFKNITFVVCLIIIGIGCTNDHKVKTKKEVTELQWPEWITQGNIYEVNIRQYTPEGTFEAFAEHLPRLKAMGVKTLWLMPIFPISKTKRKGGLGSYYAVSDFKSVNPEFGDVNSLRKLINKIHALDMKVIFDWVPNHTGWDHVWIKEHPEFYTKGKDGNITDPLNPETGESYGWTDVADLNYENVVLRKTMTENLLYWLREYDIDGYRFDIAFGVPQDFWRTLTPTLLSQKSDIFLLAESEEPDHVNKGTHHAIYGWSFHHLMNDIAKGKKSVDDIDKWLEEEGSKVKKGMRMHFTSNHDENSWNGTTAERMGAGANAFAVLSATLDGIPLIYGGQEEPLNKRLAFFEKDTISFKNFNNQEFYKMLLDLNKNNKALGAGTNLLSNFRKIGASESIYAFIRESEGDKIVVMINLTDKEAKIKTTEPLMKLKNVLTSGPVNASVNSEMSLGPWEYFIATNN